MSASQYITNSIKKTHFLLLFLLLRSRAWNLRPGTAARAASAPSSLWVLGALPMAQSPYGTTQMLPPISLSPCPERHRHLPTFPSKRQQGQGRQIPRRSRYLCALPRQHHHAPSGQRHAPPILPGSRKNRAQVGFRRGAALSPIQPHGGGEERECVPARGVRD